MVDPIDPALELSGARSRTEMLSLFLFFIYHLLRSRAAFSLPRQKCLPKLRCFEGRVAGPTPRDEAYDNSIRSCCCHHRLPNFKINRSSKLSQVNFITLCINLEDHLCIRIIPANSYSF
ncbi:hypothetical protein NPIL_243811 [Nephila pilipes]|uniref:Uncharacterized protein n=1 Tax=Nephila pilipes TaxID=299642 RepID=A0A8X6PY19_NEPPI|nr:hypothetical protein NPIL_243811 [Nephila pilipes]